VKDLPHGRRIDTFIPNYRLREGPTIGAKMLGLGPKKQHVSGQRAHQSRPMRINIFFLFNLFFSDAPCGPTTASRMFLHLSIITFYTLNHE
jgi:hypothetical protein